MNDTLQHLIELAANGSIPLAEAMQQAYEYGRIEGKIQGIKDALESLNMEAA